MTNKLILVVDDEIGIRELLSEILTEEGYDVKQASNALEARQLYEEHHPQLVLLDIWMPGEDGISVLKGWSEQGELDIPVVMMSGHASVEMAVEATRMGAFGFLEKPVALPKLLGTVAKALAAGRLRQQRFSIIDLGQSRSIADLRENLNRLLPKKTTCLLVGESGCGLELAAQKLMAATARLFVSQGTTWLENNPYEPLEEFQHGGIFIEDLDELSAAAQKGLLRLMEKLGRHDIRLICGSKVPLNALTQENNLVALELARHEMEVIHVPALREHREDFPLIAHNLLHRMVRSEEIPYRTLTSGALSILGQYDWPGNLPELANTLRTLALIAMSTEITYEDVHRFFQENGLITQSQDSNNTSPHPQLNPLFNQPMRQARDEFEKAYLEYHLRRAKGNMSRVAETVGLERTHLYRKLRQLGMTNLGFRGEMDLHDKASDHDPL